LTKNQWGGGDKGGKKTLYWGGYETHNKKKKCGYMMGENSIVDMWGGGGNPTLVNGKKKQTCFS